MRVLVERTKGRLISDGATAKSRLRKLLPIGVNTVMSEVEYLFQHDEVKQAFFEMVNGWLFDKGNFQPDRNEVKHMFMEEFFSAQLTAHLFWTQDEPRG